MIWKVLMFTALLALACGAATQAQTGMAAPLGIELGPIVVKGEAPELAYNVIGQLDLKNLVGPLIEGIEGSVIYSSRPGVNTREIFGGRVIAFRAVHYRGWFAALGGGEWYFVNTDGADVGKGAFAVGLGYSKGPLMVKIAGDAVHMEDHDMYYLRGGLSIRL